MSGGIRRFRGTGAMLAICLPLLACCAVILASKEHSELWTPLTALLALCAVVGTMVSFDVEGTLFWDGSFLPIICAVALLGPGPAVAITVVSEFAVWHRERYHLRVLPLNLVGTVVPNLVGAIAMAQIAGATNNAAFYLAFAGVACVSVALNAVLVTSFAGVLYDAPILDRLRRQHGIAAPVAVNIVLAVGAVAAYRAEGALATAFVVAGVFVFAFVAKRLAREREQSGRIADLAASRGRLVAQLLEAEDRERRAVADEVHDHLIQTLLAARQDLLEGDLSEPRLRRVLNQLDDAIAQARGLIRTTHPSVLARVGLNAALRATAEHAASRSGVALDLRIDPDVPPAHERLVFSAIRELLANVVKHSQAQHCEVSLKRRDADILLRVADDGVGFERPDLTKTASAGHLGLARLTERVEAVGGRVYVERPPAGAAVAVMLPIHLQHAGEENATPADLTSVGEH